MGQRDSTALPQACLLPPCFPAPMETPTPNPGGGLSQKNAKCSVCPGLKKLTVHLSESRRFLFYFIFFFAGREGHKNEKDKALQTQRGKADLPHGYGATFSTEPRASVLLGASCSQPRAATAPASFSSPQTPALMCRIFFPFVPPLTTLLF